MSLADDFLNSISGSVFEYAGSTLPSGFLWCDGSAVSRTTYARLFAVIGTTYGVGDGSTTFNVPDLRGRIVAGKDDMGGSAASRLTNAGGGITGTTLGATGGTETQALTTAQLPSHNHPVFINDPGHAHGMSANSYNTSWSSNVGGGVIPLSGQVTTTNSQTTGMTVRDTTGGGGSANQTATTGSGTAHNNTQPTIVLNRIIKT